MSEFYNDDGLPKTDTGTLTPEDVLAEALHAIKPGIVNGARVTAKQVLGVLRARGWTLARERRERVDPDPETGRMALALRSLGLTDEQVRRVRTDEGDWLANTTPGERVDPDLRARIEALLDRWEADGNGDMVSATAVRAELAAAEAPREPEPTGYEGITNWPTPGDNERPDIAATPDHTEVGEEPQPTLRPAGTPWDGVPFTDAELEAATDLPDHTVVGEEREACSVEPAFSQHEYVVAYCDTHDQPADQCHPGERVDPDLRVALNDVESRHRQGDWTEDGWVGNSVNGIECNGCGEPWPCSATRLRRAILARQPDEQPAIEGHYPGCSGVEGECACAGRTVKPAIPDHTEAQEGKE